jgi:hypothetical protein
MHRPAVVLLHNPSVPCETSYFIDTSCYVIFPGVLPGSNLEPVTLQAVSSLASREFRIS